MHALQTIQIIATHYRPSQKEKRTLMRWATLLVRQCFGWCASLGTDQTMTAPVDVMATINVFPLQLTHEMETTLPSRTGRGRKRYTLT